MIYRRTNPEIDSFLLFMDDKIQLFHIDAKYNSITINYMENNTSVEGIHAHGYKKVTDTSLRKLIQLMFIYKVEIR